MKLLSLMTVISDSSGPSRLLLPCAGRILRPSRRRSIRGSSPKPNASPIWPRNGRPWRPKSRRRRWLLPPRSFAVRLVAGPVGWAALGVGAGLVLAQMYYSQPDLAAIKTAASPPTGTYTYTFNGQTYTVPTNQFVGSPTAAFELSWRSRCSAFRGTPPPGMTSAGPGQLVVPACSPAQQGHSPRRLKLESSNIC